VGEGAGAPIVGFGAGSVFGIAANSQGAWADPNWGRQDRVAPSHAGCCNLE